MAKKYARMTQEEKIVIMDGLKNGLSYNEIGQQIGRGATVVGNTARALGLKKEVCEPKKTGAPWTTEDEDYLRGQYLRLQTKTMAEKLGRSEAAIRTKLSKMGCSVKEFLEEQGYTLSYVADAFGVDRKTVKGWIKAGLPVNKVQRGNKTLYFIDGPTFWRWAKHNTELIKFRHYEEYSILPQPPFAHKLRYEAVLAEIRNAV